MNVVLVVVEALRADHLGCYGYLRDTSPTIDGLARQGVTFGQAITVGTRTWQSFWSIATGLFPHNHGVRFIGDKIPGPTVRTLGETLRGAGFRTCGITRGLDAGLDRGFEVWDPQPSRGSALRDRFRTKVRSRLPIEEVPAIRGRDSQTTDLAVDWVRSVRDHKFFLLLRYIAPHWKYEPPPPFDDLFDPGYQGAHSFNAHEYGRDKKRYDMVFRNDLPRDEIEHAVAHYDGEIRYADYEVARLLAGLKANGVLDNTFIVFTSDHGESLGEHDYYFEHGAYVYEQEVRIPLIIRGPGIPAGMLVETQVQNVDIVPTVLDLLGLPPEQKIDGRSTTPLFRGDASSWCSYAFAESEQDFVWQCPKRYMSGVEGYMRMVRSPKWKLVYIPRHIEHEFELYDLECDPEEQRNVVADHAEIAQTFKLELTDWMRNRGTPPDAPHLDEEVVGRLRGLGYID